MLEPSKVPKQHFTCNTNKFLITKKAHNPAHRPKIWDLGLCLNGAHNIGYNIVSNSSLHASDD